MSETLEQLLENRKQVALEKEKLVHSGLEDLAALVTDGDVLAIEEYFAKRGRIFKLLPRPNSDGPVHISVPKGRGIYSQLTKRDAVNQVLLKARRPMTSQAVYEELVKGGYPFSGKDPLTVFRTEIYKYAARAERGLFVPLADYVRAHEGNGHTRNGGTQPNAQGYFGRRPAFVEANFDVSSAEEGLAFFGLGREEDLDRLDSGDFASEIPGAAESAADIDDVLEIDSSVPSLQREPQNGELNGLASAEPSADTEPTEPVEPAEPVVEIAASPVSLNGGCALEAKLEESSLLN